MINLSFGVQISDNQYLVFCKIVILKICFIIYTPIQKKIHLEISILSASVFGFLYKLSLVIPFQFLHKEEGSLKISNLI